MSRVCVNVSGKRFEFNKDVLANKKCDRLPQMVFYAAKSGLSLEFTIDRCPESFGAVLNYYVNGKLHMPTTVCGDLFRRELEYWGVGEDALAKCCKYRFQLEMRDLEVREQVNDSIDGPPTLGSHDDGGSMQLHQDSIRRKVWRIVDNRESSIKAKVYLVVISILVIVSMVTVAFSTEPGLTRPPTKCELLNYLEEKDFDDLEIVRQIIGYPACDSTSDKNDVFHREDYEWTVYHVNNTTTLNTGKRRRRSFNFGNPGSEDDNNTFTIPTDSTSTDGSSRTTPSVVVNSSLIPDSGSTESGSTSSTSATSSSTGVTVFTSMGPSSPSTTRTPVSTPSSSSSAESQSSTSPSASSTQEPRTGESSNQCEGNVGKQRTIEVPHVGFRLKTFQVLDIVFLVLFAVDIILYLTTCPSVKLYFVTVIYLTYVVSVCVHIIFLISASIYPLRSTWISLLLCIMVARSARLYKVIQHTRTWLVLMNAVPLCLVDLAVVSVPMFSCVSLFACMFYLLEPMESVTSVPVAWYFSLTSMTTVGYGDVGPISGGGQFVACLCAAVGISFIAIVVGLSVGAISSVYRLCLVHEKHCSPGGCPERVHPYKCPSIDNGNKWHTNGLSHEIKNVDAVGIVDGTYAKPDLKSRSASIYSGIGCSFNSESQEEITTTVSSSPIV